MMMLVRLPQGVGTVLPEGLLVADDIRVADGGDDPDFVEGVFLFLLVEVAELDALEGVLVVVGEPTDFVDGAVGPFPSLTHPASI
jgi:hypothetical protein